MTRKDAVTTAMLVLTSLPFIPIIALFASGSLSWMRGMTGVLLFAGVIVGVLGGTFGGIVMAIARKNPLWLITTAVAAGAGYWWLLAARGMAVAGMH